MRRNATLHCLAVRFFVILSLLIRFAGGQDGNEKNPRMVSEAKIEVRGGKQYVIGEHEPYTGIISENPYEDGGGKARFTVVAGFLDGPQRLWHADGKTLSMEFHCVRDKKQGIFRSWWPNGKLREELNYVNGVVTGPTRSWHENGQLAHIENGPSDNPIGFFVAFYENGRARTTGAVRDGKPDGLWVKWDEEGKEISRKYYSAAIGKEVTEQEWLARKE